MDFIDKKQTVIIAFELMISEEISKEDFQKRITEFMKDEELLHIELFKSIFEEISTTLNALSRKDLKQRKLMIESYLY